MTRTELRYHGFEFSNRQFQHSFQTLSNIIEVVGATGRMLADTDRKRSEHDRQACIEALRSVYRMTDNVMRDFQDVAGGKPVLVDVEVTPTS